MQAPAFNLRNLLILVALSATGVALANSALQKPAVQVDPIERLATIKPGFGPASQAAALEATAGAMALARERIARRPGDWLNQEGYARASMARFRLTGDYADLTAAQGALDRAEKSTPSDSGPMLTDAVFAATTHNLDRLDRRLGGIARMAIMAQPEERAEAVALVGDLDFYSGRYDSALRHYQQAAALADGPGIAFRLGRYHQRTGDSDAAIGYFASAANKTRAKSPQFLSSVWLQVGVVELERGNWESAERHFARADALFPGFWLNQAHLAQMRAVRGDIAGARAAYTRIATRSGNPEVMDALAALYRADGNAPQSRYWSGRASAIWEERLKLLPQAAYGHALDHQMLFGDAQTALDLARKNFAARPYGDSAILLAWAYLANGQAAKAKTVLETLGRTKWQSAQQHAALAEAYAMLGQGKASEREREKAMAVNPKIFDPAAPMIWFGHH
ncbi:MAG TPA: hypothetical protein VGN36_01305 [Sphingorhabdus sp.]|jgi:Tfp pilus assembly protein PilF|nr:hypothetical protein [Sphingorhabdus sp.]